MDDSLTNFLASLDTIAFNREGPVEFMDGGVEAEGVKLHSEYLTARELRKLLTEVES